MPPKEKGSSVDDFFNNLPKEDNTPADIFDEIKKPAATAPVPGKEGATEGEEAEARKNRRHRRLEDQLRQEREANIALNERVKVLSEVDKFTRETSGEIDPRLLRIFGTDENSKEAARIFEQIRADDRAKAKEDAIREIEARQSNEVKEQSQYETLIDTEFENLEDVYGVDLTSDAPAARKARREFIELIEKVSPKDQQGEITQLADFESTFELYRNSTQQAPRDTSNDRRKEMSSNSMQRPGSGANGLPPKVTPGFRGWMKDYNVRPGQN